MKLKSGDNHEEHCFSCDGSFTHDDAWLQFEHARYVTTNPTDNPHRNGRNSSTNISIDLKSNNFFTFHDRQLFYIAFDNHTIFHNNAWTAGNHSPSSSRRFYERNLV